MYQECSMRVTKVADSPMFCDKTYIYEKKCCKQEYFKEALSWCNFNPKGIIIFPYDNKQIILLNLLEIIILNYNTLRKRKSLNITLSGKNNR